MRLLSLLAAGTAVLACSPAYAQEAPADTIANDGDIVVTARKREESLKDVPISATAISGEEIEKRGLVAVREVAQLTPSLNINSDGAGRAFVAIRGVGTTLIDTVQPGVGIFVDGIYQPNTSYLNNPMTDVERVEVLRGPQGTLYGKNTLGGAINVITRMPSNELQGKVMASYAGPDDAWTAGASISGPIIEDRLQARVAYSHQQQDGFIRNTLLNVDQNALKTDTVSGTVRVLPSDDITWTVNGYYTWLTGGSVPYAFISSPDVYLDEVQRNSANEQKFKYRGINSKIEFPLAGLNTDVTLITAYDKRSVTTDDADPDFTANNTLLSDGTDDLTTKTGELRFDSELSSQFSTIVGFFYSREVRDTSQVITVLPGVFNLLNTTTSRTESDTYAVFGNVFWSPSDALEISAGLRWDRQDRLASGLQVSQFPAPGTVVTGGELKETNWSPRVAVSYKLNDDTMVYGSVARGARGGGFNPPAVPANLRTYKGDSAWTYELGSKYVSPNRDLSLSVALFYNDYTDYLGLNSILSTPPTFTTIDLNTGDVKSYGVELEFVVKPTPQWTITGGGSLMKARLTNTDIYTSITGRTLSSDRLPFQPDWNFSLNSDYTVPVGGGDMSFTVGAIGKGSRIPASIRQVTPEFPGHPELQQLDAYVLVNGSISYRTGGFEITAFVNNAFNVDYYESYIERTTLVLAGLPNSDVGIIGDKRRYGVRTSFRF